MWAVQLIFHLLSAPSFSEELIYKGHKITVSFVEYSEDLGEHIDISMQSPNTKLLHLFIQEWSNQYNFTTVTRVSDLEGEDFFS